MNVLRNCLARHPDKHFVDYLISGLTRGFRIGYQGPDLCRTAPNLKSALDHPDIVQENLERECSLGHTAGPFDSKPFKNFQVHPIGVVPKKNSQKWRTIVHLSYPTGNSINDFISKDDFRLTYITVDTAIATIKRLGKGCLLSKVDVESAFRIVPVHPDDWHLLGMQWQGKFYFDMRLSFGCRSSPYIFNTLADAIEWIGKHEFNIEHLFHLLDDFLAVEESSHNPQAMIRLLDLFSHLNVPTAPGKVVGPVTCLEFLGIILDTVLLEARLPADKIARIKDLISLFQHKKKCTKRELLSLIGVFSFAARIILPGRAFLSHMIELSKTVKSLDHFIYLNKTFHADLAIWLTFLHLWNGRSFFLEEHFSSSPDLQLYTDAAGAIGYGGYFKGHWFRGDWSPDQLLNPKMGISIAYQELFPIVLAVLSWGDSWQGKRILFHCDNEATVAIINSGKSKSIPIANLLRKIVLKSALGNFLVRATHIRGIDNGIADALSRKQMTRFRRLAPLADPVPTNIAEQLKAL